MFCGSSVTPEPIAAGELLLSFSPTIGLFERSLTYASFQNVFFSTGGGTLRRAAIGLGGILISGRKPIGGGSNLCGVGDLRAIFGEPGALPGPPPFDGGASVFELLENVFVGGGGGGAGVLPFKVACLPAIPGWGGGGGGGST